MLIAIKKLKTKQVFDIISADNPQGIFGNNNCEHFDIINELFSLIKDTGFIIFNVNLKPYNISNQKSWEKIRSKFYLDDSKKSSAIISKEDAIKKYQLIAKENKFNISDFHWIKRKTNYPTEIYFLCLHVKK